MSCLPCLMMLGNQEGMGVVAEETFADKATAVTTAIKDVAGAVGALVSGKTVELKKESGPGGQILIKRDYTPYYIIGGAILVAAGIGGYFLLRRRRAVAMNPKRRLKRPYSYAKRHKLLPKLGTGGRFALLTEELRRKKGIRHPGRLAAWIGRGKHGRKKFAALGTAGRKRARGRGRRKVYRIAANRRRRSA